MNSIITSKTQGTGNDTFTVHPDSANNEVFDVSKYVYVIVDKDTMASVKVTQNTFLDSVTDIDGNGHPVKENIGVYSYYKNVLVPCHDIASATTLAGFSELYYMHPLNQTSKYIMYSGSDKLTPKKAFAILNGNVPAIDSYNSVDGRQKLANAFYKGDVALTNSKIVWLDPYAGNELSKNCMYIPDTILQQNGETLSLQRRQNKEPIIDSASQPRMFLRRVVDTTNVLPDRTYNLFNGKPVASSSTIPSDIPYKNSIYVAIGMAPYAKHPYFVNALKNSKYTTASQTPIDSYFEEISAIRYTLIGVMKYHFNFFYNNTKINDLTPYIDSISPIGKKVDTWCSYSDLTKISDGKKVCDDIYTLLNNNIAYSHFLPHAFEMKSGYTIDKVVRVGNSVMSKIWKPVTLSDGSPSSVNGVTIDNQGDNSWYGTNEDGTPNYQELNTRVAGITKYQGAYENRVDVSLGTHDTAGPASNIGVAAVDQSYITAENNYAKTLNYSPNGKIHSGYVTPTESSAYEMPTITVNVYITDKDQ